MVSAGLAPARSMRSFHPWASATSSMSRTASSTSGSESGTRRRRQGLRDRRIGARGGRDRASIGWTCLRRRRRRAPVVVGAPRRGHGHDGSQLVGAAGSTEAGDGPFALGAVVIRELLARADASRRANPDRLVGDLDPAVRCAGVVDEPGEVAADRGVAAPGAIDPEDPDTPVREVLFLPRLARFAVPDELSGVLDDARILRNRLEGEDAVAV
jgi:hypothetical protein